MLIFVDVTNNSVLPSKESQGKTSRFVVQEGKKPNRSTFVILTKNNHNFFQIDIATNFSVIVLLPHFCSKFIPHQKPILYEDQKLNRGSTVFQYMLTIVKSINNLLYSVGNECFVFPPTSHEEIIVFLLPKKIALGRNYKTSSSYCKHRRVGKEEGGRKHM